MMQTSVHLFGFPTEVLCVLRHLETTRSDTACVNRFARSKEDTVGLEEMDSARLASHVRYLAAAPATVRFEFLRIVFGELILERTRQRDVTRYRPRFLVGCELTEFRELIRHVLYFVTVRRTHNEHVVDHLFGDAVRDSNYAVRAADSYHLSAEFDSLGSRTPCYITETGDSNRLAFDILARLVKQVLREIECTETGSFRTENRTAPCHTFAGEDTGVVLTRELLIHTIEETDLASAYAYVTGRYILIRADAAPELQHKRLAETHDLRIGLTDRIKVRTSLGSAHRQGRKGVFEGLLKA